MGFDLLESCPEQDVGNFLQTVYTPEKSGRPPTDPANNSAGKKLSPGAATGLHRGTSIPNSGPRTGPTMPV